MLAFGSAISELPFFSASRAAIPNLVEREEDISWANSLITVGVHAGIAVGPLLGGLIVASAGPTWVFGINAISFVISLILTITVHGRFTDPERETAEDGDSGLTAGIRFLFGEPVLRRMSLAWLVFVLGMGMGMVADAPIAESFGTGAKPRGDLNGRSIPCFDTANRYGKGLEMANSYHAIVIGGGHNGMVAAAYLAKAGARVVVCEARHKTGGAADTMAPWPDLPDFKVTTLSYVMSLMPDTILKDLEMERHGYRVHPVGPYVVPLPDGRVMIEYDDPKQNYEEFAAIDKRDADNLERWEAWMGGIADVLGPVLMTTPPHLGSKRPGDLLEQLRLAWRFRGFDVKTVGEVTRLFTMSVADLLDRFFVSDEIKAAMSINGLIGTWAGPREPGTGYVMVHHSIGDVGDGTLGSWGVPEGGMGGVAEALERSAKSFGAEVRTNARVEKVLISGGRAQGVVLEGGEELRAPIVVTACHPQITFLRQIDRYELPEDFVRDIENWSSRSGTVKVNLALSSLPKLAEKPGWTDYSGGFEIAPSIEQLETSFEEARHGKAATLPFSDGCIPSTLDPSLAPEGAHVMSLFTQWVPHTWSDEQPQDELEAYADRVIDAYEQVAPGFKDSILARQVIGPYEMEHEWGLIGGNIFHGELSANQLFHMRPAPGYADYRTPIRGLYQCSSATHAGGGVTGIPAYNCVREIRADRKRRRGRG